MAGTLTVQNLQGPSSGANAGKIIIPSGQTLDVSGGTLTPSAGQVVQVVQEYAASVGHITTTSTTLVASGITASITPKYSNSLIIVEYSCSMAIAAAASSSMRSMMYYSIGAGARASMPGTGVYQVSYLDQAGGYAPMIFKGNYTATSTSTLTFEPYFLSGIGNTVYFTHSSASYSLTLTEIAQ